jgi:hypothetical protein
MCTKPHLGKTPDKTGLVEWLKWYSTCLANVEALSSNPIPKLIN